MPRGVFCTKHTRIILAVNGRSNITMLTEYFRYINNNPERYWFKRKLYGWGWTPATREGWLATIVFVALIVWNVDRLSQVEVNDEFINKVVVQSIGLVLLFLVICFKTGEPPKWQWGPPREKE